MRTEDILKFLREPKPVRGFRVAFRGRPECRRDVCKLIYGGQQRQMTKQYAYYHPGVLDRYKIKRMGPGLIYTNGLPSDFKERLGAMCERLQITEVAFLPNGMRTPRELAVRRAMKRGVILKLAGTPRTKWSYGVPEDPI